MSGEEVTYQYDQLGRMIAASTTGPEWGQSFTFDGFGNLTQQTVTKGTAPSMSIAVDQSTNRLVASNISYDAAGNMHFYISNVTRSMTYDSLNRVSRVERHDYATESYLYSARNERMVVKRKNTWPLNSWEDPDEVNFYDITGVLIGVYQIEKARNDNYYGAYYPIRIDEKERVYFGGRLILTGSRDGGVQLAIYTDRLGSVVRDTNSSYRYYPYGQEIGGATTNDKPKFGTYTRDSWSGLDYAMNRYYYSSWGRFTSPDPYQASGGVSDPGSWNRYAYVQGDPVNYFDPAGLQRAKPYCDWYSDNIGVEGGGFYFRHGYWSYLECEDGGGGGGDGSGAPPEDGKGPNRWREAMKKQREKVKKAIYGSKTAGHFSLQILDCIAGKESGWDPSIDNGLGYRGLFQIGELAWKDAYGNTVNYMTDVFDAEKSADAAGRILNNFLRYTVGRRGWASGTFTEAQLKRAIADYNGMKDKEAYAQQVWDCAKKMKAGDIDGAMAAIGK